MHLVQELNVGTVEYEISKFLILDNIYIPGDLSQINYCPIVFSVVHRRNAGKSIIFN